MLKRGVLAEVEEVSVVEAEVLLGVIGGMGVVLRSLIAIIGRVVVVVGVVRVGVVVTSVACGHARIVALHEDCGVGGAVGGRMGLLDYEQPCPA
jgi:hypothetical protein